MSRVVLKCSCSLSRFRSHKLRLLRSSGRVVYFVPSEAVRGPRGGRPPGRPPTLSYTACYHFVPSEAVRRPRGGRPPGRPPTLSYYTCYHFVPSEAAADSGLYNTIKGVGRGLRPPRPSAIRRTEGCRILVRFCSRVGPTLCAGKTPQPPNHPHHKILYKH